MEELRRGGREEGRRKGMEMGGGEQVRMNEGERFVVSLSPRKREQWKLTTILPPSFIISSSPPRKGEELKLGGEAGSRNKG